MNTPETKKLRTVVDLYLNDLEIDGRSPVTIKGYRSKLDIFCRWFEESKFSETPPAADTMLAFKKYMSAEGKSTNTIAQYLIVLRTFFDWAIDVLKAYSKNPISKRLIPKNKTDGKPYEEFLTKDEIQRIFSIPRTDVRIRNKEPRNYAIMVTFITTGLRSAELRNLTLNSIDFQNRRIFVNRGKGGKFRVVALPALAEVAIDLYLKTGYRPDTVSGDDYLFGAVTAGQWHALDASAVYRIVEKYVQSITGKNLSPHKLRHVYSRTLLQAGAPLEEIQSMLGHASMQTTQIYTGRLLLPTEDSTAHKVFDGMCSEQSPTVKTA